MSLIDGLIIHTIVNPDKRSQHSMLMEFYQLDAEIEHAYNTKSYKELFHDLNFYFKQVKAKALLKALNTV